MDSSCAAIILSEIEQACNYEAWVGSLQEHPDDFHDLFGLALSSNPFPMVHRRAGPCHR
jgi:hypothetical protein